MDVPVTGDEALLQEVPNHREVSLDEEINEFELTVVQDDDLVEVEMPESVGGGTCIV